MAVPVVEKKVQKPTEPPKSKPKKKKRASKPKPVPVTASKQATHLSSNPYRILKAVVDMMRLRYTSTNYESLTLNEILEEIKLTDLKSDTRQWVLQVNTIKAGFCVCFCGEEGGWRNEILNGFPSG